MPTTGVETNQLISTPNLAFCFLAGSQQEPRGAEFGCLQQVTIKTKKVRLLLFPAQATCAYTKSVAQDGQSMPNAVTGVGWGTERFHKEGLFQRVFGIFLVVSGPPGRARNGAQRIVAPGATLERRSTFQIQPMAA